MSFTPKVSVIMPSLNVGDYIRECIESVVNQTLQDIEIICVDAGSTDGTLDVLQEYAEKDSRIKLILSEKKSYGHQMNLGLDAATGEYIGIVETDDYVANNMYEALYQIAAKNDVDFVKADFYRFVHEDGELNLNYHSLSENPEVYNKVLNPQKDLSLFNLIMNTWSGIYKREFLTKNQIRHNESPGASYQDNGFWFKTFAHAQRAYFVDQPFYMNRRDNPNSSVHNKAKVYCMNEEYAYILAFLKQNPELHERLMPTYCVRKYHNYVFTYRRIGDEFKLGYLVRFSEEFKSDFDQGYLHQELFGENSWESLMQIIFEPVDYYLSTINTQTASLVQQSRRCQIEIETLKQQIDEMESSLSFRLGRMITWLPRKIRGGIRCYKEHGFGYTMNRLCQKATRTTK